MKRYKINYDAIASGVATLEEVFGGRQTDRLIEEIAWEIAKEAEGIRGWRTTSQVINDKVSVEICAEFSDRGLIDMDYIIVSINNYTKAPEYGTGREFYIRDRERSCDITLSDDECKAVEECANELYVINNQLRGAEGC